MLRVLEERGFPVTELRPLASARSEGLELDYLGRPRAVRRLTEDAFEGIQIALFSAGATRSREFAPAAVEAGAVVIDNSSAFRMDPEVPLVVPEVNEDALQGHSGIVANPNCVAAPLVVALKPIADAVGLERVVVASYQSVSGTGQAAVTELVEQTAGLPGRRRARAGGLPAPHRLQRPAPHRRLRRRRLHGRGAEGRRRDPQDARAARAAGQRDLRPRAGAVRPLAGRPRRDDRRADGRRRAQPADGGPRGGARGRARRLPATRSRARPPAATTCWWAASARTPRTRAASPCGS